MWAGEEQYFYFIWEKTKAQGICFQDKMNNTAAISLVVWSKIDEPLSDDEDEANKPQHSSQRITGKKSRMEGRSYSAMLYGDQEACNYIVHPHPQTMTIIHTSLVIIMKYKI